jgi:hypothetical protein
MFPGYYKPSDFNIWEDCLFVFDANVLLNLYRYKKTTQETLFSILEKFSDRLFLPYQAAYEYQKNRITVITEQEEAYSKVEKILTENFSQIKNALNTFKRHPYINTDDFTGKIDLIQDEITKDLKTKKNDHPSLIFEDYIREKLDGLFENKVGQQYDLKDGDKKKFQERYDNKIPPGYEDNKKDENKFGDLILWYEVMEKASKDKVNIILVTDDVKDDWWWKPKGKTFGPRPELIEEFNNTTGHSIYLYQTEHFIKFAQERLGTNDEVAKDAIEDVKSVKEFDEKQKSTTFTGVNKEILNKGYLKYLQYKDCKLNYSTNAHNSHTNDYIIDILADLAKERLSRQLGKDEHIILPENLTKLSPEWLNVLNTNIDDESNINFLNKKSEEEKDSEDE